jgi:hypothetical protein
MWQYVVGIMIATCAPIAGILHHTDVLFRLSFAGVSLPIFLCFEDLAEPTLPQ